MNEHIPFLTSKAKPVSPQWEVGNGRGVGRFFLFLSDSPTEYSGD